MGTGLQPLLLATGGASDFRDGAKEGAHDGASISPAEGECFNAPGGELSGKTYDVDEVPCSGEHDPHAHRGQLVGGRPALTEKPGRARTDRAGAAKAPVGDAFYAHYEAGLRLVDPAESVTARKRLGLDTTPPSEGGDGGSGEGGGGVGMEV